MMNVIKPNCRLQFTGEDLDFIVRVLGKKAPNPQTLLKLLADEDTRDLILDDEALVRAVLEHPHCLRISQHFYFYILVRHVFCRAGLAERILADYVSAVLSEFSHIEHTQCRAPGQSKPLEYFVDMLAALQQADDATSFYLRAHIGNYSLFMSGVFPDRVRFRAERRGAPGLKYYEELGSINYRVASDHRLAHKYDLTDIFGTLSERFQTTRLALNDLGERLLSINNDMDSRIEAVLKHSLDVGLQ